jgi:Holliday junction resolvase
MPNKRYIKGRRKEYKLIHEERDKGNIAFRTAGSHSPVDVVSINTKEKVITLIQSKSNKMSVREKDKLLIENKELNGLFNVFFIVK